MRRYMNLVALILAYVEEAKKCGGIPIPRLNEYTHDQVVYHVKLCEEAGYLDIEVSPHDKMPTAIHRITWAGHEILDQLRAEYPDC